MDAPQEERDGWSIEEAEALILSLMGVTSARVVTRPGGEVTEIHVVTTDEVAPKQTVRNVESVLLANLDLAVDHRMISVAQTRGPVRESRSSPALESAPTRPSPEKRLVFRSHSVETERAHRLRHRVEIEWDGRRYTGEASAPDLSRARLEAAAEATLSAVEVAVAATLEGDDDARAGVSLEVDGVKVIQAFDRQFVVVAVHAFGGRDVVSLAGATAVEESADRAAILATLQATDRWVRGRI